eukprot:6197262-Pleurochrysis_carterae.AAC.1
MSNTRGAIAAAKVLGGKGRTTVGGGVPCAPRTRQSVALNPQATTVASARDAKRNAAIALAGQREAEKRARRLHLERLRDDARAEEKQLERARVAEEQQRREKERIEEQRLEEEMRLEAAERLARLEAERLARLEAERLAEEHHLRERCIEEEGAEWMASEAAPYDLADVPDMARCAYQLFWNSASTIMRQDEIRATLLAAIGVPRSERQRPWVEHFWATLLHVNRSMFRRWGSSFVLKEGENLWSKRKLLN